MGLLGAPSRARARRGSVALGRAPLGGRRANTFAMSSGEPLAAKKLSTHLKMRIRVNRTLPGPTVSAVLPLRRKARVGAWLSAHLAS